MEADLVGIFNAEKKKPPRERRAVEDDSGGGNSFVPFCDPLHLAVDFFFFFSSFFERFLRYPQITTSFLFFNNFQVYPPHMMVDFIDSEREWERDK